ncbi:gpi8p [Stylonychia lemnae]|uniref:Gpi8p n=1 Tax=Stylonychia lemnae TaxID=5949 RepID=A0A077ZU58_STYLE|nr:gpi8p [Stylonychia lemnae]|eukprot:CDW73443.1 gpi8p [Stylonychia lemnae]
MSSSKFFFNYRHTGNTIAIYRYLKEKGITDDQFPQSKRINSNEKTKIFIFMNGHGGENFFKIQDTEVVHSEDFGKVFNEMDIKNKYSEILLLLDTCEAMTLFDRVNAPNIMMVGTSVLGQHAYSHLIDSSLNTYISDKFSFFFHEFIRTKNFNRKVKISDFLNLFPYSKLDSDLQIKNTFKNKSPDQMFLYEFLPIDKEDVLGGQDLDKNQEELKFYNFNEFDENSLII